MQERYGSNVHILDWALHIDESTPYIHEDREAILKVLSEKKDKSGYDYGIELMFCLCVRIDELKALRWSDIDFRNKTISVSREVVLRKDENGIYHHVELAHTKGGEKGSRILPLSDRAIQADAQLDAIRSCFA